MKKSPLGMGPLLTLALILSVLSRNGLAQIPPPPREIQIGILISTGNAGAFETIPISFGDLTVDISEVDAASRYYYYWDMQRSSLPGFSSVTVKEGVAVPFKIGANSSLANNLLFVTRGPCSVPIEVSYKLADGSDPIYAVLNTEMGFYFGLNVDAPFLGWGLELPFDGDSLPMFSQEQTVYVTVSRKKNIADETAPQAPQ